MYPKTHVTVIRIEIINLKYDIEDNPQFKTHIQEFLNFSGLDESKLEYESSTKLYEQRDITIILGDDWNVDNNLIYCDEPIN